MHVRPLSRLLVVPIAFAVLSCEPTSTEPPTDALSTEEIPGPLAATVPSPEKLIYWSGNQYNVTLPDGTPARIVRNKSSYVTNFKIYKYRNGAYRHELTIDQMQHNGTDRFLSARLVKPNGQWIRFDTQGRILESFDCKFGCDISYEGGVDRDAVCLISTSGAFESAACDALKYTAIAAGNSMFINGLVGFGIWVFGTPASTPVAAKFGWAAIASGITAASTGIAYLQCKKDKDADCGPGGPDPCDNFVGTPRIS